MGLCVCICILCFIGSVSAGSGTAWTKSFFLQQGQGAIHQVQVDNFALFVLTSPPGAQFELYALQVATPGAQSCPPVGVIRQQASYRNQNSFVLPRGQWCVQVYAWRGSGTYFLEATSVSSPGPMPPTIRPTSFPTTFPVKPTFTTKPTTLRPSPLPTVQPKPSEPYKVSVQSAQIAALRSNVHPYLVSGERTFLEWIAEPTGCKTPIDIPVVMMSAESVKSMQSAVCSLNLNMYVYKDCDPKVLQSCKPIAYDDSPGPYAYVGISFPQDKSRYFVMIQGVSGSGTYTLTSRSFVANRDQPIIMMAQSEGV